MLSIKQIDASPPKDKPYRILDSDRLYLVVSPSGFKSWQFRYTFDDKKKTLSFGRYPLVTLSKARELATEARRVIAGGADPGEGKRKKEKEVDTFGLIFREWFNRKQSTWSDKYRSELLGMFERDILPEIGNLRMEQIEPLTVLTVISRFEERGALERASKARRRIGEVFKFAIITGRAKYNPAPDLAGAMKGYQKKHYPFLPESQIAAFNVALSGYGGSVICRIATQVLQYTVMRTKELRFLQWSDVDFDERVITISGDKMKMGRDHIVPMADQVVALLNELKPVTGHLPYIFAGRNKRNQPICENAVLQVIRQIGYEGIASGHGFRHQFSTVMHEKEWPSQIIERQLAHVDKNSIRGVYNHAQYLDKRREMMQFWANWIDQI